MSLDTLIVVCCLLGIVFSMVQMMKEVKLRGVDDSIDSRRPWFLTIFTFGYLLYIWYYIEVTRRETGRIGWLFYVFIISVLGLIIIVHTV